MVYNLVMNEQAIIAKLIFEGLRNDEIKQIMVLLPKKLENARTEKMKFTKTPFLNSVGQELGKLLQKESWKFEGLKKLWDAGGRDERLIVLSTLGKLSKKEYQAVKNFVLEILNDVSDWEICDQLALKVVVNLAVQKTDEIFELLTQWRNSDNKWLRRLSIATIPPFIRAKKDEWQRCLNFINGAMNETDKDVKKAIGWALREVSKKNPEAVYEFLKKWSLKPDKNVRWIIKEGMKKLSKDKQDELLKLLSKSER